MCFMGQTRRAVLLLVTDPRGDRSSRGAMHKLPPTSPRARGDTIPAELRARLSPWGAASDPALLSTSEKLPNLRHLRDRPRWIGASGARQPQPLLDSPASHKGSAQPAASPPPPCFSPRRDPAPLPNLAATSRGPAPWAAWVGDGGHGARGYPAGRHCRRAPQLPPAPAACPSHLPAHRKF